MLIYVVEIRQIVECYSLFFSVFIRGKIFEKATFCEGNRRNRMYLRSRWLVLLLSFFVHYLPVSNDK